MAIKLNSNAPTSARYHEQALGAIHDLSMIRYNGAVVWQAAAITAPSNLRVNGLTSDSDSTCTLTWTAATITGAAGITYYIYRNGVQAATTTSTSYTFTTSAISSWSNVTLTVKAYNETTGFSSASNAVTFTYVQPVTLTAPSNLKVNGASSSTSSSCRLTWTEIGRAHV